jgi:hypothetical protein
MQQFNVIRSGSTIIRIDDPVTPELVDSRLIKIQQILDRNKRLSKDYIVRSKTSPTSSHHQ